ncbi:hypothetical protein Nepgr_018598 [Nepenthes gracilis]|uniref:Cytochrome P450 n=1 Tax=Nepenthes gracilis TaxID=150966 RepID=A0AAD3SUD7_NEPGR|nr:hypothetical protein Nepgr_018598 [Nepenthes gracilis]
MDVFHAFLLCALIFLIVPLRIIFPFRRRKANLNLPPAPPTLPVIGNLHQLGKMPHLSLSKLAKNIGPLMFLWLGEIPAVVISSAAMAKEVLRTHDRVFSGRPQLYTAKRLFYGCADITFSPNNAYWRHVRKICILELLNPKRVQSYNFIRKEEISRLIHRIIDSGPGTVNLTKTLSLYANHVVCYVILGKNFSDGADYDRHGLKKMIEELEELLGGFSIGEFFPSAEFINVITGQKSRLDRCFRQFDNFFNEIIEERLDPTREETKGKYLLDVLLSIQKDGSGDMPLTVSNVKAILLDMFAAGIDTASITLDWAMTELMINPTVMKQAQVEVRSIIGERKIVLESDLPQLHYLKAVLKEVLRLHPPAPMSLPRESIEDVTIDNYVIPAKTRVFINIYAIGRDPKSWKDPETFIPERFMDSSIDFKGQDFEFLPFGGGRRVCPGITFALVTIELALAQLLHSFEWDLPPGVDAKDLDMRETFGLTTRKISDLIVVVKPLSIELSKIKSEKERDFKHV